MAQAKPEQEQQAAPKRRRRRRSRGGLMLVISVAVLVVGLPVLIVSLTGATLRAPGWLSERIETRLNEAMGTGRITLDNVDLVLERSIRPRVRLRNLGIFDDSGAEIARLNEVRARLDTRKLLQGAPSMTAVRLSGAQITVRRGADGTFALSLGTGAGTSGTLAGVLDGLDRVFATEPLSGLDRIAADQLTITLEDGRSGRIWQVTEGRIELNQSAGSLDLTVAADVFNGTEELATTVIGFRTEKGSAKATLTATFENAAAADIAAQSPALAFLAVLDAPISGALRASIDAEGVIDGFAGTLEVGAGAVRPTEDTPPIAFQRGQAYVEYQPETQTLAFNRLSVQTEAGRVTAEGRALLDDFRAGWPETLVGQFQLSDASLQPQGVFAEPMRFPRGAIDFRLRLDPFTLDIGQVALLDEDRRFRGKGRIRATESGWHAALDLGLNTITLDRLAALWPVAVAPGARDWLQRNVLGGAISDLAGAFRFRTGAPPQISLSFVYSDATVRVIRTLPHVTGGAGYASLTGKTFTLVVEEGTVEPPQGAAIDVAGSVFRIPDVTRTPGVADITLATDSTITAALSLLDLPPFELMTRAELPVDLATGRAVTRTSIGFELLREVLIEDVSYAVEGRLLDMHSDWLVKGRPVEAAALDVVASPQGIEIGGEGRLGRVPVNVRWTQAFGPENAGRSRLDGTVELGQALLDEFGIALPQGSVSGGGLADIAVDLVKGEAPAFTLRSDLNRVGLRLAALDWSKPRNATGTLEIAGRLGPKPAIDRLILQAPGLSASGVVDLRDDGGLATAQFDRVRVGDWLDGPVTLRGRAPGQSPAVAVNGGRIDLRRASLGGSAEDGVDGGSQSGPLSLTLDRLTVTEGISLTRFRGEFRAGAGLSGRFAGRVNDGAVIDGTVVPTPAGAAIRLLSEDAGAALADAGVLRNARGGTLDLTLNPAGSTGVYNGRLRIQNTRMIRNSVLTELISAISIVGLLDQLNSGGITLTDVEADFQLSPQRLVLLGSSAVGPSLGISLDGVYDLAGDRLDLQGVVSPVYFLNGIGQIFSRGRDGLFGFNFRMTGAAKEPRVSVNPLSILTPGAFREIFRRAPPQPIARQ